MELHEVFAWAMIGFAICLSIMWGWVLWRVEFKDRLRK